MNLFVLDTDILSLWQHAHAAVSRHIASRRPDELAVTVITVQEQLDGWHSRLPHAKTSKQIADLYQRLADTVRFFSRVTILPFPEAAVLRYEQLRKAHRRLGKNDLRIAAIVLEGGDKLITRNTRDFQQIVGLQIEDWST
jgi:tRNA(fMet)-specific endonuclease VapC